MWEQKSKGLFTKKLVSAAQLAGKDYLIAKHGDSFHPNVQTAFDNGIPCLLFYENDPELLVGSGLNEKNWPDDKNKDLQAIIDAVMVGGVDGTPRAVHGIMVDCSKVVQTNGKILTAQWIAQSGAHLMNRVWKLLGIPVYLYMNMSPINQYKNDPVSIETLYGFIASWQGVSTVDWAQVGADGYPVASERPTLPYDDGQPFKFWYYAVDEDGNLDVLFNGDKAGLNKELGYEIQEPPDPSTGSGTEEEDESGSGSGETPDTPLATGVVTLKLGAEEMALARRFVAAMEEMAKPVI